MLNVSVCRKLANTGRQANGIEWKERDGSAYNEVEQTQFQSPVFFCTHFEFGWQASIFCHNVTYIWINILFRVCANNFKFKWAKGHAYLRKLKSLLFIVGIFFGPVCTAHSALCNHSPPSRRRLPSLSLSLPRWADSIILILLYDSFDINSLVFNLQFNLLRQHLAQQSKSGANDTINMEIYCKKHSET